MPPVLRILDYGASVAETSAGGGDAAPATGVDTAPTGGFQVHLGEFFEGPFDLLLSLIAKHKLDVTEVALSKVTDEFIAHIRAQSRGGAEWDLGETTEFLVVAATLLDLKTARLLPSGEVDDEEDLALLEARDLLFARLLQYRAYKQVSAVFAAKMAEERGRTPRAVGLEPAMAGLLPEVLLGLGPQELADLAARALAPKPTQSISIEHLHASPVSVREQAAILVTALRRFRTSTFRALTADCQGTLVVIARFLALLELYRENLVAFEQVTPLGELSVRWIGSDMSGDADSADFTVPDDIAEFDQSDQPALALVPDGGDLDDRTS